MFLTIFERKTDDDDDDQRTVLFFLPLLPIVAYRYVFNVTNSNVLIKNKSNAIPKQIIL